jgi:hypothetical protein
LTKENPRSVQELRSQLGLIRRNAGPFGGVTSAPAQAHFPWGTILILALVVGVFWMLFRRRRSYVQYPAAGAAPGAYGPGGYAGPGPGGYAGPGGMAGGGMGSNLAGGLAGGLAAGAGIVAGEELAHHFLDGDRRQVIPPASDDGSNQGNSNSDMGGADFGVNDPGSWDDGSSGGGGGDFGGGGDGGGGDWS